MAAEPAVVASRGAVCTVTINRPAKLNALNGAVRAGLAAEAAVLADDTDTRVVALEGAGRAFSAGADLRGGGDGGGLKPASSEWLVRRRPGSEWTRLLDVWEALPQVTVAKVRGPAIGGGCLLAASCDFRVAATDAFFSIPEVALGLPLPWGGVPRARSA